MFHQGLAHFGYTLTSAYGQLFPLLPISLVNYLDGRLISIIAMTLGAK